MFNKVDIDRAVGLIKSGYMNIDDIKNIEFKDAVQLQLTNSQSA